MQLQARRSWELFIWKCSVKNMMLEHWQLFPLCMVILAAQQWAVIPLQTHSSRHFAGIWNPKHRTKSFPLPMVNGKTLEWAAICLLLWKKHLHPFCISLDLKAMIPTNPQIILNTFPVMFSTMLLWALTEILLCGEARLQTNTNQSWVCLVQMHRHWRI